MTREYTDNVGRCFDAHARALVLYARQWLDDAAARDAVQDAFVRLLRKGNAPANILAWLYRAVRSTAIDHLRSHRRRQQRERVVGSERANWFAPQPDQAIDAEQAQAALAGLPSEQREVIVLRLWSELPLAEIADVCQAPISTIYSRYKAGLAALRKHLEPSSSLCDDDRTRLSPRS